jgi:putative endonuclease
MRGGNSSSIWHIYLLECADGSLYTGIATDVERRFDEHVAGTGARYTRSHKPVRVLASRQVGSRSDALKAELAIKRLPKERKLAAMLSQRTPVASDGDTA